MFVVPRNYAAAHARDSETMQPKGLQKKKVAIVGSGCAGLGAAWALKNTDYEIHLFEKEPRLGGHTNTQPFTTLSGTTLQVDTGFIVLNTATYPNFIAFLARLNVPTVPTQMTFAVSRDSGAFEWSGEPRGLFAQRRNLFRLRHWRLLFDVIRFNQFALDLLSDEGEGVEELTIGQYLQREGYSKAFRDDYLIPMTAAVWSTAPDKASLEFPAQTLVRFMWNHHLLSTLAERPDWLTIPGGSQQYIDAIVKDLGSQLHVHESCTVTGLVRPPVDSKDAVAMAWTDGEGKRTADFFEHVVLACHGDQVLPLIADEAQLEQLKEDRFECCKDSVLNPSKGDDSGRGSGATPFEIQTFSAFRTTQNICYLHSDPSLLPTRPATWSSWNYLVNSPTSPNHQHPQQQLQPQTTPSDKSSTSPHPPGPAVSLTYNMNILQHHPYPDHGHILVTMNPPHPPRESLTQGIYRYTHPLYTVPAVRAQQHLATLQGHRGVSYAGAWTGYGFHEDGFTSGLRAAQEDLGAEVDLPGGRVVDAKFARGRRPILRGRDYALRIAILVVQLVVLFGDMVWRVPLVWLPLKLAVGVVDRGLGFAEEVGVID